MSTPTPKLLNDAIVSVIVLAPTVITAGARAGLDVLASADSLPAATTTWTPAVTAAVTALSSARETPPPRDMLITLGLPDVAAACIANWIPETISDVAPDPSALRTYESGTVVRWVVLDVETEVGADGGCEYQEKKTHLDRNYVSSLGDAKVLRRDRPSAVRSVALVVNLGQTLCSEPKRRASAKRLMLGVDSSILPTQISIS